MRQSFLVLASLFMALSSAPAFAGSSHPGCDCKDCGAQCEHAKGEKCTCATKCNCKDKAHKTCKKCHSAEEAAPSTPKK